MTQTNNEFQILCAQIDKKFGKGTIQKLNDTVNVNPDSVISTGSIAIDTALGVGGYPKGKIIEIFGGESMGKSTLCLQAVANAQKMDLNCVYIDAENSLDPQYAAAVGCNIDKLTISQPDYGEQALEIVNMCAKSGAVGLVIVDSVAALVPKSELEGEVIDNNVAGQARMMSKALRMITGNANKTGCTIIFVNQIRMKIGMMFGSPKVTPGGNALKFYASQRLEISRTGSEKNGEDITGNTTKVKIIKNKVAPPFKVAEFTIKFGKGVDNLQEILDLAIEDGVMQKSGAWFKYEETSIAQGRIAALEWLKENEEITNKIKNNILELRGLI